jgi:SAM-dependent methyltransferase
LSNRLSDSVRSRLRCPVCRSPLDLAGEDVRCSGAQCGARFPIVDGIPILINEKTSIFSLDDFTERRDTTFIERRSAVQAWLHRLLDRLPDTSASVNTERHYTRFRDLLLGTTPAPTVLVIGGSILGQGMGPLAQARPIELVATDVSAGPLTALVCDAHDIPFADESFDGVIAQAVCEHVVDPYRCAEEMHRVLKKGGFLYAETPFIQQVHMGPYDFTRFTHSGHRRLFRRFDEIGSGPVCGPGMALAWSYEYFLLSFASSTAMRGLLRGFARLTSFFLKYFDYYLIDKPAAFDAASGFYFLGCKNGNVLADRDLIPYYARRFPTGGSARDVPVAQAPQGPRLATARTLDQRR